MKTWQTWVVAILGVSAVVTAVRPAEAMSLSIGGQAAGADGYKTKVQGATTIDFNTGAAPTSGMISYSSQNGASQVVKGNVSGQHATPWEDSTSYLAVQPQNNVTLKFANAVNYFGLYWGSVDTYNHLDFYSGNTLIRSFSGQDVSSTARGGWVGPSDNVYVDFFANKGETFDRVVMRSDSPAFETDNHAYRLAKSVPEPGSIVGLAALAMLGTATLRKRKSA